MRYICDMAKYRIGILMGGYSSEVEISLLSGQTVYDHLDRQYFEPYRIHILPEGWNVLDTSGEMHPINKNDFSAHINGERMTFDALFNAIHGTPGEDGLMQGYLSLLDIPHTSCDAFEAALTFNKAECNLLLTTLGVRVAPSVLTHSKVDPSAVREACVKKQLKLPVFVKPSRSGSSFGVSKVDRWDDLPQALLFAAKEDHRLVIEQGILGTEVGCGIARIKGEPAVLEITEIIPKKAFFDYEAKYSGASEEVTPARLSKMVSDEIKSITHFVYEHLHLRGVVRCDFIVDQVTQRPVLIEINSIPGMSPASIIPQQVVASGRTLSEFFTLLLQETLRDAQDRSFPRVL